MGFATPIAAPIAQETALPEFGTDLLDRSPAENGLLGLYSYHKTIRNASANEGDVNHNGYHSYLLRIRSA
jgi:hypothetical protein